MPHFRLAKMEHHPTTVAEGVESPPEFDRIADVLGPVEQIIISADQQLGTIQQRMAGQAGENAADVDRRVREAASEQRRRVAELRKELTDRVAELAARFDGMLNVLDDVDRQLATWGGEEATGIRVTVTERQRVELAHETPTADLATVQAKRVEALPSSPPPGAPPSPATAEQVPEAEEGKGIRRWFRRSKRSSA